MSKLQVGDVIKQTYQTGAPNRLVVALTTDPDVVTVFDPEDIRLRNVLTWGHELVLVATDKTKVQAEEHLKEHADEETSGVLLV